MNLQRALITAISSASLCLGFSVQAQERHEEKREERRAPAPVAEHRTIPVRPSPPAFQKHAPGQHPQYVDRRHPVRVLAPRVVIHGGHAWNHWEHPDFARPTYYWEWRSIRHVTCIAEDSYGDQYPVTESTTPGFGLEAMNSVEDDAMDRCYAESGQDQTCYLATCSHF